MAVVVMGEGGVVKVGDNRNVYLVRWRKEERHEEGREGLGEGHEKAREVGGVKKTGRVRGRQEG